MANNKLTMQEKVEMATNYLNLIQGAKGMLNEARLQHAALEEGHDQAIDDFSGPIYEEVKGLRWVSNQIFNYWKATPDEVAAAAKLKEAAKEK